jgi:hypothetical protein
MLAEHVRQQEHTNRAILAAIHNRQSPASAAPASKKASAAARPTARADVFKFVLWLTLVSLSMQHFAIDQTQALRYMQVGSRKAAPKGQRCINHQRLQYLQVHPPKTVQRVPDLLQRLLDSRQPCHRRPQH